MTNINWEKYKKVIKKEFSEKEETEEVKNYIFSSQLDKVNLILEHMDTVGGIHSRNIAITGDRGTGKTSFIETLKLVLEKQNYYVFDIVSPTVLSSHLNILEIVISSIYREIDQFIDSHDVHDRGRLIQHLKKVMNAIAVEKKQSDYFKQSKPEIEMLTDLSHRTFLDEEIKELFCYFKKVLNNRQDSCKEVIKDLVLIIDDLDLVENNLVYDLLRDIQHYLDSQLIVIFAYKEGQLEQSMFEHLAKGNEALLNHGVIDSNVIFGQIERFLTKLVPLSNRIPLFKQDELLNKTIGEFLASLDPSYGVGENLEFITKDSEKNKNNLTIREWFYESIFYRTNLKLDPIDIREEASRLMPKTLREMVQLCEELHSMQVITRSMDKLAGVEGLRKNIGAFRRYIGYKNSTYFNLATMEFFQKWELAESHQANYLAYHFLMSYYQESFEQNQKLGYPLNLSKSGYPLTLRTMEPYNITLGDIYALMEELKYTEGISADTYYIVYILKVYYSLRLSELLYNVVLHHKLFVHVKEEATTFYMATSTEELQIEKNHEQEATKLTDKEYREHIMTAIEKVPALQAYLELVNAQFMPQNFNYDRSGSRDDDFYLISWLKDDDLPEYSRLFKSLFLNSEVAAKGQIQRNIGKRESVFRYRNLYSYLPLQLTSATFYKIDFLAFAIKADLLMYNVVRFVEEEGDTIPYFMSNMFHIDVFVRHNYNENNNKGKFAYIAKQIVFGLWQGSNQRAHDLKHWYKSFDTVFGTKIEALHLLVDIAEQIKISDKQTTDVSALSEEQKRDEQAKKVAEKLAAIYHHIGMSRILPRLHQLPFIAEIKSNKELLQHFSEAIVKLEKYASDTINVGNLSQFRESLKKIGQTYPSIQVLVDKLHRKQKLYVEFIQDFIETVNKLGEADESN